MSHWKQKKVSKIKGLRSLVGILLTLRMFLILLIALRILSTV